MTTILTIGADDWSELGLAPAVGVRFRFRPVNTDTIDGRVVSEKQWGVILDDDGSADTEIPDAVAGNGLYVSSSLRGFRSCVVASYPSGTLTLAALLGYAVDPVTLAPAEAPDAWWLALQEAVIGGGGGGGGAVDSVNGKTGPVVLVPGDIAESSTRKWMTDVERAKLAGVATDATANATDAALRDRSSHTGTQTSASISDFTEAAQDAVAAMLAQGTNVTLTYNDIANTLTIASAAGGGGIDAETARDTIGAALIGVGNISVAVNDALDTITISTTATVNSTDAALRDRSTHTGTQSADSVVDGTTNKAYTAAEKTKLAGVATSATANSSDATLLARTNHTGSQPSSTISDFTTAVNALISAVIAGAPGTLDTLDELAAALGDDANFAATVTTALGLRAPIASPTFTGDPKAPTPTAGDNDTSIATTAFVATAIAAAALVVLNAQTASYTLVLADAGKAVEVTSASASVITVPPNSSVAFPIGTVIEVDRFGAGSVTVAAGAGVTIQNAASSLALRAQYSACTLRKRATDTWLISGDLT